MTTALHHGSVTGGKMKKNCDGIKWSMVVPRDIEKYVRLD